MRGAGVGPGLTRPGHKALSFILPHILRVPPILRTSTGFVFPEFPESIHFSANAGDPAGSELLFCLRRLCLSSLLRRSSPRSVAPGPLYKASACPVPFDCHE